MISEKLNDLSKQIRSPVPFWFLNGHVDEGQIIQEFEMMAEKGIEDVIVHPRYGLQAEYLSDDWFEIFGWCVREAKKHGMHVWIYDELNWPSGTAGMSVQKIDPNYRSKYLSVDRKPLREIDLNVFEPGVCIIAANIEGGSVTKTKLLEDLNALLSLTGDWHIFNCKLRYDPYYIDTLSQDAVDCFKRVTYEEYYKRFDAEFGKTIRAAFTDEPSIYWVSVGYDDWNLPYTDDFFETFESRYGYNPRPMIPYIFYPGRDPATGLSMAAFRADYWEHAGYLFNQRYHGTLSNWCREHGIIYTGHNNHEEPLRYQIRFQGNMFGTMRTMDIPGVDHLGKQTLGNHWISIIGHKICSSEAHISGKARCMSESFGVMEWDTTFENLKRVTDWQFALGINLLVPHAIYHTISGMTKRECPPSFFYQSPHWEDFDEFSKYIRRLEDMLTGGRHICKVAVMYPSTGLWAGYQPDRKTTEFEHTDNFLNSLCLELIRNQIDFDLLDFRALREAKLEDSKLMLADEVYEVLIVPAAPYLRREEVARLTEIVRSGVNTTFFYRLMEPIEHNMPDAMRGASFVRTEELVSFVEILKRQVNHDIQIVGGGAEDIMTYRREKDSRKITFLLNRSDKHRKVVALLKDYPDPAVFDPESGEYTKLEGRESGPKLQVQLRFQPNQSYFIVSGVADAKNAKDLSGEPSPIALRDLQVEVPFNVASIYHFCYRPSSECSTAEDVFASGNASTPTFEPKEVDVRTNPRYLPVNWDPNPPDFTQHAGCYEAEIEINFDPAAIRMIVDKDFSECEVYVNGKQVELQPCWTSLASKHSPNGSTLASKLANLKSQPFLTDFQDVCADIGHLLKRGTNHFRVISPTKLSEPLRLVGDFRVRIEGTKVVLLEPGYVNPFGLEQDYPFYSGTIVYRAHFDLDKKYSALILNLHDVRDTATVWVNGRFAGKRLWAPYVVDITDLAQTGLNILEIEIRNNMANLINGNPRLLGLTNPPTIAGFE